MAGHEVRRRHQIRGADGGLAEAQVALGQAAGLLGVVHEVGLTVEVRGVANDLNGVLVGAHGAVGAHAPDLHVGLTGGGGVDLLEHRQRGEGHIVHDAHGEVVLGRLLLQVLVHRQDLARGGVLGGQAVPARHDLHGDTPLLIDGAHVLIQGLAGGAGLFGAVQHGKALAGRGHGGQEVLGGEGAIQVDVDEAHLLPLGGEAVHSLLGGLGGGAHEDDDPLGIRRAVVIENVIFPAGQLADLGHIVLRSFRDGLHLPVAGLPALEENVRVYGGTPGGGMLRVQGVGPEGPQGIHVHQGTQVLVVQGFDLLDLVGGAEAVEEVEEGHPAVDSGEVGHGAQVHSFLGRGGRQQGKAGLSDAHDVAVVAEDAQGVGAEGPGGHMEHAGQHFACDLIHIGDHQQQPLGGGIGGGQGAGLQGTVDRAGGAALGLHLHHLHRLAEQVLLPVGGPLVHMFRHG